jgi:hypothetical protein
MPPTEDIGTIDDLRWDSYVKCSGPEFDSFWENHLSEERDLLFILGRGFDPRMCEGFEALLEAGGDGKRDSFLVDIDDDASAPSQNHEELASENEEQLQELIDRRGKLTTESIDMWSGEGHRRRRTGPRNATQLIRKDDIESYNDIVVDVSSLPRSIYVPLTGKLLYLVDDINENQITSEHNSIINLHVITASDPILDSMINEVGPDEDAHYIPRFSGKMELEAQEEIPKIWIPILGESKYHQLRRIYDHVSPEEVTPMLPFPAKNPRRGDALVEEYHTLLFDEWRVQPQNIVYASERNPFQVYRSIMNTVNLYSKALNPLGGCRTAVSALSSKLLSIGALLAAYDSKTKVNGPDIAIAHIESQGYSIDGDLSEYDSSTLCSLWLAGECYSA